MAMDYSDKLTPRSAAQTLQDYQDNHQIELFMQEMLSVVCTILPEDPYEYMMNHVVSNRPAPPPAESQLCGSGALWVLLPAGDPLSAEHWRLRRCWLTGKGSFCISTEPATETREGDKVKIKAPRNTASATHPIEVGGSFREVDDEEAARPFTFVLLTGGKEVFLAAGSEEQRDEWFNLLGHFADADRRKGPLPKSTIVSPRSGGTQVVDAIGPTDIPMVLPTTKDPVKDVKVQPIQASQETRDPERTLKPILKTKPSQIESGKVPAIRIPRRLPNDPMEACGDSTRRSSIRFSDDVERREFSVARAEPVPANMRAHESRKKPALGKVTARTADGQEVAVREKPKASTADGKEEPVREKPAASTADGKEEPVREKPKAPQSPKGEEAQTVLSSPHSEILEGEIGKNIVQDMLDQVSNIKEKEPEMAEDPMSPAIAEDPPSPGGVEAASLVDDLIAETERREGESIVPSARSSASPGEAIGEIAAGMIDSMMLDPIISIMDEPMDPVMLLLGETPVVSSRAVVTDHEADPVADHVSDHVIEPAADHVADPVSDHVSDHAADHVSDHAADQVAAQRVADDLMGKLLGLHVAGSEASDAIDMTEVDAPLEKLLVLVFDSLDYKTLDHSLFIDQLLSTFRSLGLAETHASTLQIKLSPGSVVAEIFGPPAVRKHLEALSLQYVEVMGCYARKKAGATPRWKQRWVSNLSDATVLSDLNRQTDAQAAELLNQWIDNGESEVMTSRWKSRPTTCLSDATVLSSSSMYIEAEAAELLNLWMETPTSEAMTSRSAMDAMANQMISDFVADSSGVQAVGPKESAQRAILAAKAKAQQLQEPEVVEDFNEEPLTDAQQVAASTTEAMVRVAPLEAVKQDALEPVATETPRSAVDSQAHQSTVPYVTIAKTLASHAMSQAMVSECPSSAVVSETNSPHGEHRQQLQEFIQETIGQSIMRFASDLVEGIIQEAVDKWDTSEPGQLQKPSPPSPIAASEQTQNAAATETHPPAAVTEPAAEEQDRKPETAAHPEGPVQPERPAQPDTHAEAETPAQPTTHSGETAKPAPEQRDDAAEVAATSEQTQHTNAAAAETHPPAAVTEPAAEEQDRKPETAAQPEGPVHPERPAQPDTHAEAETPAQPTTHSGETAKPAPEHRDDAAEVAATSEQTQHTNAAAAETHPPAAVTEPAAEEQDRKPETAAQPEGPVHPERPAQPDTHAEAETPAQPTTHSGETAQRVAEQRDDAAEVAATSEQTQHTNAAATETHPPAAVTEPAAEEQDRKPETAAQPEGPVHPERPAQPDTHAEAETLAQPTTHSGETAQRVAEQRVAEQRDDAAEVAATSKQTQHTNAAATETHPPAAVTEPAAEEQDRKPETAAQPEGPVQPERPAQPDTHAEAETPAQPTAHAEAERPAEAVLEQPQQYEQQQEEEELREVGTPVSVGATSYSLLCDSYAADAANRTLEGVLSKAEEDAKPKLPEEVEDIKPQDSLSCVLPEDVATDDQVYHQHDHERPSVEGSPVSVGVASQSMACISYANEIAIKAVDYAMHSEEAASDIMRPISAAISEPVDVAREVTDAVFAHAREHPASIPSPASPIEHPVEVTQEAAHEHPVEESQEVQEHPARQEVIQASQEHSVEVRQDTQEHPVEVTQEHTVELAPQLRRPSTPVSVGAASMSLACDSCASDIAHRTMDYALAHTLRQQAEAEAEAEAQAQAEAEAQAQAEAEAQAQAQAAQSQEAAQPERGVSAEVASQEAEIKPPAQKPSDAAIDPGKPPEKPPIQPPVTPSEAPAVVEAAKPAEVSAVEPVEHAVRPGTPESVGATSNSVACDTYAADVAQRSLDHALVSEQQRAKAAAAQPTQPTQPTEPIPSASTKPSQPTEATKPKERPPASSGTPAKPPIPPGASQPKPVKEPTEPGTPSTPMSVGGTSNSVICDTCAADMSKIALHQALEMDARMPQASQPAVETQQSATHEGRSAASAALRQDTASCHDNETSIGAADAELAKGLVTHAMEDAVAAEGTASDVHTLEAEGSSVHPVGPLIKPGAETEAGSRTPVSVGGASVSQACDAYALAVANSSVDLVLAQMQASPEVQQSPWETQPSQPGTVVKQPVQTQPVQTQPVQPMEPVKPLQPESQQLPPVPGALERRDTGSVATESIAVGQIDLAHIVSSAVAEACREANLSIIASVDTEVHESDPQQLVRQAVEEALRLEISQRVSEVQSKETKDTPGTPVSIGGASVSAANDADVMALASRSVEHVLAAVRASQKEAGSPASVSGVSNSAAQDADAAALASKSVEKVMATLQLLPVDQDQAIHSVATDPPVLQLDQLNPAEIARVAAEEAIRAEQAAREQAEDARDTQPAQPATAQPKAKADPQTSAASTGGTSVGQPVAADAASRAAAIALRGAGDASVHTVTRSDATPQPSDAPSAVPGTISEASNSMAQQPRADVGGILSAALAEAARDEVETTVIASEPGSLAQPDPTQLALAVAEAEIRAEQAVKEQQQAEQRADLHPKVQRQGIQQQNSPQTREDRPSTALSTGEPIASNVASRAAALALGGAGDPSVYTVARSDATPQAGRQPQVPATISEASNSMAQPLTDLGGIVANALAEIARDTEMTVVAAASDAGSLAHLDPGQLAQVVAEEAIRAEEAVKEQRQGAPGKARGTEQQIQQASTPPAVPSAVSDMSLAEQADLGRIVSSALDQVAQEDAHTTVIAATSDADTQPNAAQLTSAAADEAIRAVEAARTHQANGPEPISPVSVEEKPDAPYATDVANRAVLMAVAGEGTGSDAQTLIAETASEVGQPGVPTVVDRAVEAAMSDRDAEAVSEVSHLQEQKMGIELVHDVLPKAVVDGPATVIISEASHVTTTMKDAQRMAEQAAHEAIQDATQGDAARSVIVSDGSATADPTQAAGHPSTEVTKPADAGPAPGSEGRQPVQPEGQEALTTITDVSDSAEQTRADVGELLSAAVEQAAHDDTHTTVIAAQSDTGTLARPHAAELAAAAAEQAIIGAVQEAADSQPKAPAEKPAAADTQPADIPETPAAVQEAADSQPKAPAEKPAAADTQPADIPETPAAVQEAADSRPKAPAEKPAAADTQPADIPETPAAVQEAADSQPKAPAEKPAAADTQPADMPETPAVQEAADSQPEPPAEKPATADTQPADLPETPATVSRRDNVAADRMVAHAAEGAMNTSQTSMQGSQGVSQTSFHVSQTTFQVSQSTFQESHTTFDAGEATQSTFQTGHGGSLFTSTAPAVVGPGQGPRVPPLWDPHPRSDGFYGWQARSPSQASESDHPALPSDTLPTFVPAVDDRDATLPVSDLHGHWADPGAQTVKPRSGFTARSGYSDDSSGHSPGRGQPIVNTSILTQLCSLLNAPDTPDSEVERVRRGPLRKVKTPEEQSPAWGGGIPSAASPASQSLGASATISPAKSKKSMHSAARSADETLPSYPSTGPYGYSDEQSPFRTVPRFQPDMPSQHRERRDREEQVHDPFLEHTTPRSHDQAGASLVDPNLIAQLCHLLNAPDTPSSAAVEVHRASKAAASEAKATKPAQPAPAEETLQRPLGPLSRPSQPTETWPMFQADLHRPETPPEERRERDRELAALARGRADPFDVDESATARTDDERQQSLVDPSLIAQLCRLLNQPETPPSDTERIRREPPPKRPKEQPGLIRPDFHMGDGESQPHTARTSIRSRGTASDQAGESDVNEALEEEVFNIMDMLCVQIEEPQA